MQYGTLFFSVALLSAIASFNLCSVFPPPVLITNAIFLESKTSTIWGDPLLISSGSPHIVDVLDSKKIALVINTGGGNTEHRLNDAIALRRATLKNKVPYCTNMSTAQACLQAIKSLKTKKLEVTALQDI